MLNLQVAAAYYNFPHGQEFQEFKDDQLYPTIITIRVKKFFDGPRDE